MRDSAEEIAAKLTKAQRDAFAEYPAGWLDEYSTPPWPPFWLRTDLHEFSEMAAKAVFHHAWRWNALGLAVRAILETPDAE